MTQIMLPLEYTAEVMFPRKRKTSLINIIDYYEFSINNNESELLATIDTNINLSCIRKIDNIYIMPETNIFMNNNKITEKDVLSDKNVDRVDLITPMKNITAINISERLYSLNLQKAKHISDIFTCFPALKIQKNKTDNNELYLGFPEVKTILNTDLDKRLKDVQELFNNLYLVDNYLYKPSNIPNIAIQMDKEGLLNYFSMNVSQSIGIEIPFNRSYLLDFNSKDLKINIIQPEEIINTEQDAINIIFKSLCENIKTEIIYMPECLHKTNLVAILNNFKCKETIEIQDFNNLQNSVSKLIDFLYPSLRNSYRTNKYAQFLFDDRIRQIGEMIAKNSIDLKKIPMIT